MAISKQQSLPLTVARRSKGAPTLLVAASIACTLALSACQTMPSSAPATTTSKTTNTDIVAPTGNNSDNEAYQEVYPADPYIPPVTEQRPPVAEPVVPPRRVIIIPAEDDVIVAPPVLPSTPQPNLPPILPPVAPPALPEPSHNELLERARQNSVQRQPQATSNNSNLPAFRNLMQAGVSQLSAGNLTSAENSFTRAQRLAPKSSAVYFYLSQVAIKKNQPRKAEAMARRGLSVSEDSTRRQSLWQLVLRAGQMQNNPRVIREAQQALR